MTEFSMGDKFSPFLHDAVILYAIAINESLNRGLNPKDGLTLAKHMKQKVFMGGCHIWFIERKIIGRRSYDIKQNIFQFYFSE